jgi:hypothetical protein
MTTALGAQPVHMQVKGCLDVSAQISLETEGLDLGLASIMNP